MVSPFTSVSTALKSLLIPASLKVPMSTSTIREISFGGERPANSAGKSCLNANWRSDKNLLIHGRFRSKLFLLSLTASCSFLSCSGVSVPVRPRRPRPFFPLRCLFLRSVRRRPARRCCSFLVFLLRRLLNHQRPAAAATATPVPIIVEVISLSTDGCGSALCVSCGLRVLSALACLAAPCTQESRRSLSSCSIISNPATILSIFSFSDASMLSAAESMPLLVLMCSVSISIPDLYANISRAWRD